MQPSVVQGCLQGGPGCGKSGQSPPSGTVPYPWARRGLLHRCRAVPCPTLAVPPASCLWTSPKRGARGGRCTPALGAGVAAAARAGTWQESLLSPPLGDLPLQRSPAPSQSCIPPRAASPAVPRGGTGRVVKAKNPRFRKVKD